MIKSGFSRFNVLPKFAREEFVRGNPNPIEYLPYSIPWTDSYMDMLVLFRDISYTEKAIELNILGIDSKQVSYNFTYGLHSKGGQIVLQRQCWF